MKFVPALWALLPLSVALSAHADESPRNQLSAGWLHVQTNEKSDELNTTSNGTTTTSPGTSSSLNNSDTLGLTYTRFINDSWSAQFVGGIPPEFELSGKGHTPFGNLESFDKLASVRQWSPTLLGIYTFGNPSQALRPYVGIGVSYTKFDNIELDKGFESAMISTGNAAITAGAYAQGTGGRSLQSDAAAGYLTPGSPTFNATLAGAYSQSAAYAAANPASVDVKAESSVDPVATIGLDYRISERWYAQGSVSYLPLSTTATITLKSSAGTLATSKASLDINPVVTYIGVGYRF